MARQCCNVSQCAKLLCRIQKARVIPTKNPCGRSVLCSLKYALIYQHRVLMMAHGHALQSDDDRKPLRKARKVSREPSTSKVSSTVMYSVLSLTHSLLLRFYFRYQKPVLRKYLGDREKLLSRAARSLKRNHENHLPK